LASVAITVLLYNGPLLCGFNVPIEWLRSQQAVSKRMTDSVQTAYRVVRSHLSFVIILSKPSKTSAANVQ